MKIHPIALQAGLMTGGLIALTYLLCYLFRLEWVLSTGLQLGHWVVAGWGAVLGIRWMRSEGVTFSTKRYIWFQLSTMLILASAVLLALQIIVHTWVDPGMRESLADMQWEQMEEMLSNWGDFPLSEELMREGFLAAWSPWGLIQAFLVGALGWIALAWVISRFTPKDEVEFGDEMFQ
ncbi:MAG: hypothetical protein RJA19_997 [Bacteroidota bacterium]|jgi:hypothetical protein